MPYDIQFHGSVVRVHFHGEVTSADLFSLAIDAQRIEADGEITPHRIIDLSDCEMVSLQSTAVEQMARQRRVAALKNPVKSAIIARSPLQYGLARMFQILNDHPRITIQVFQSAAEASKWIEDGSV